MRICIPIVVVIINIVIHGRGWTEERGVTTARNREKLFRGQLSGKASFISAPGKHNTMARMYVLHRYVYVHLGPQVGIAMNDWLTDCRTNGRKVGRNDWWHRNPLPCSVSGGFLLLYFSTV